jgi:hypothetical protein
VASVADIYHRAKSYKAHCIGESTLQSDLFRLLNVYSLLFPLLSQMTNTVGRYFREDYQCFIDFYRTMRNELFMGYNYMRYICTYFTQAYMNTSLSIVELFTSIVPELEILCDRMEDFFLNKYYKTESLGRRLYFNEQSILEIKYYLMQEKLKENASKKEKE